eukprot:TRINITY_DN11974_c0_g1_i1.p1 TRINITY_DN11974_c0_g1~~TRINITY_DN11974_c0_g1_i1.p1  ORF type:complete len:839 (+),score=179.27 TRINITY_DN11974_c0_g1_i1:29-2545(+)
MSSKNLFAQYFSRLIGSTLKEYLVDFSAENISKMSIGINNDLTFDNLKIREDVLSKFSLPLVISEGRIGRLKITLGIAYKNPPAEIEIEGVELHLRPINEVETMAKMVADDPGRKLGDATAAAMGEGSFKRVKLKQWEAKMMKYFESMTPPSFIQKKIESVLAGMRVNVRNLVIFFEDRNIIGVPAVLRLRLGELLAVSTDETWHMNFNPDAKMLFKLVSISKLSLSISYLDKSNNFPTSNPISSLHRGSTINMSKIPLSEMRNKSRTVKEESKSKQFSRMQDYRDFEAKLAQLKDQDEVILHPVDFAVRISMLKDPSHALEEPRLPQKRVEVELPAPLTFVLNNVQLAYLRNIGTTMSALQLIQRNLHLRPTVPCGKDTARHWWRYAVRAVQEETRQVKYDLMTSVRRTLQMRRYIELYKRTQEMIHVPWFEKLSAEEENQFKMLEQTMPLRELLTYREYAITELRMEAKRYFNSNKDVAGMKPLIEVWSNVINDDRAFSSRRAPEPKNIGLTTAEQSDLYEILAMDKARVLDSYLKGEPNLPDEVLLELVVSVRAVTLLLAHEHTTARSDFRFDQIKTIYDNCECQICETRRLNDPLPRQMPTQAEAREENEVVEEQKQPQINIPRTIRVNDNVRVGTPSSSYIPSQSNFEQLVEEKPSIYHSVNSGGIPDFQSRSHLKRQASGVSVYHSVDGLDQPSRVHEGRHEIRMRDGERYEMMAEEGDSFDKHLHDLINEIRQEHEKEDKAGKGKGDATRGSDTDVLIREQLRQQLLLVIEVLGVHGTVHMKRDESMLTKEPLTIDHVLVFTPLCLRELKRRHNTAAVSYTHLTLPTIYSV